MEEANHKLSAILNPTSDEDWQMFHKGECPVPYPVTTTIGGIDEDDVDAEEYANFVKRYCEQTSIWSAKSGTDAAALTVAWINDNYHIYEKEKTP